MSVVRGSLFVDGLQKGRLSLTLSQCLQVVLSDETWGGNFGGNWCRRGPWDYLCALEWAFGEQNMAGRLV